MARMCDAFDDFLSRLSSIEGAEKGAHRDVGM